MLNFINSLSIFKGFNTEQKALLFKLLEKREYKKREVIIYEGDQDKSLFLIYSGSVRVLKRTDLNELVEIAFLSKGNYFGEFSLIDNKPRSASVEAFEESILYKLTYLSYTELCRKFPEVEACILKGFLLDIVYKLRTTSESIINEGLLFTL